VEFRALVSGSIQLHLLCHVTLLYCQVDPNPKPKAKSKAGKSLLPLPILPLMWQPLAHLNQCYSSNSLPFLPCGLGLRYACVIWWFFLASCLPITLLRDADPRNITMGCCELSLDLESPCAVFRASNCYLMRAHNMRVECGVVLCH
jgi:hypothetical protein